MELRDGARFVGLQVLQVETPDQEVLTPDVFRYQVHLHRQGKGGENNRNRINRTGLKPLAMAI